MSILISWLGPLRAICMAIDGVAFSLLDNAYQIVINLSTAELFQHETIRSLTNNIYILIGVVAFFRLALVLVNAIIDPEKLNEKGKGLSNIFFRVVGMILLLAVAPFLFQMSYELQEKIVGGDPDKNIIFKTILGDTANMGGSNAGKALQNIALSSLITVNENYYESFDELECVSNGDGTCTNQGGYVYGKECDWDNCHSAISLYNDLYVNENMSPAKLAKWAGVSKKIDGEEVYVFDYMMIVTTVVGVFMTYVIISFAIDIAVRMFELLVLEVLSPLFIATFVDPKSAQSGPFKNWLTAVGKSYANLYIKLAVLALIILLISLVNKSKIFNSMADLSGWTKIFVVIGLLIFAKKAPNWIMDIIGIKGDSGLGGLSIGKKLGGMALAGGLASKGIDKLKQGLGKGARSLGGAALGSLGATSAARRLKRNEQRALGSLRDKYNSVKNSPHGSKSAAIKETLAEASRRARERAQAGINASGYGAREGLQAGAQTKNAAEMAGLLGKTYSGMTKEAGHVGIKEKISANFEDSTAKAKLKAFGVATNEELRDLADDANKIRKANKLRNAPIELENGKRKSTDFQNAIEMNKTVKETFSSTPGCEALAHDPTSATDVYLADMINKGLVSNVEISKNSTTGKTEISFTDKSGARISGNKSLEAILEHGNATFSMAGRDQIALDCANNISSTQEAYITARAKVKEIESDVSNLSTNLSKLNIDRSSILNGDGMSTTVKVKLSSGETEEKSIQAIYDDYSKTTDTDKKGKLKSVLESTPQGKALLSIDSSILSIEEQQETLKEASEAWKSEESKQKNLLVEFCKQFTKNDSKNNPIANPDGVTLVGSYDDASGEFKANTDESKTYSEDVARQNTQVKIGKLKEKADASFESAKESKEGK